ncbi:hypothetical protein HPB52_017101 [Rhipicephalus sanguineus]|uniref:Ig-like domain-containing protein n=1 Tax=Rhipicephalus sanguineus TaxID=34632 RepID=A0A9D4SWH9_RHISA|nr:hypothetical protein HPB52_017101 [Rhipicephalus sanguineus]
MVVFGVRLRLALREKRLASTLVAELNAQRTIDASTFEVHGGTLSILPTDKAHPGPSKTRLGPEPPDIARELSSPPSPSGVVVRKHEPVTLRCSADGQPPPQIAWFHDGKSVRDSATRMVLPEEQLFFQQVQHSRREQDTGIYWCTATNQLGTARSRNASVEIAGEWPT